MPKTAVPSAPEQPQVAPPDDLLQAERAVFGWRCRWLRYYDAEGRLVPTREEIAEAERQRAEQAEQRAVQAEQRLAELEAELERLRGELANE